MKPDLLARAVLLRPQIIPYLTAGFYKTYDYMENTIIRLVWSVYNGNLGGEFVDIMQNLIVGQMRQAFSAAWEDDGNTSFELPAFLVMPLESMIIEQSNYDIINNYYYDIVDARVDQTPIAPLLARVALWANRYNEAYNKAVVLINAQTGGKMEWFLGRTEKHCPSCMALNGIVAYAREWEELDVRPQGGPNWALQQRDDGCGGWRCDCQLTPTSRRKTPNAKDRIIKAVYG